MIISRQLIKSAAIAVATLAATSGSSFAGGEVVYANGIRQGAAAVPVPAPVPVPDVSTGYYLRIDAAYSRGDVGKYSTSNSNADQLRADAHLDNFPRLGFGVGYQFSRMFRGDISFDWRSDVTSRVPNSTLRYTAPNAAPLAPLADPGPIAMRDTVTDNFTSTNMTGMLNGYIDLPVTSRLTPYIGAGVGFVRHHARGELNRTTTCVSAVDCDPTIAIDPGATTLNSATRIGIGGADYALATAVMAGLSYQVWDNTKLDVGYRWLHLQGTVFSGALGTSAENLKIPDQNIHEMRVGLRYDIN